VLAEGAHHGGGQIVLPVGAPGIAAGDEEQRGGLIDHDAPGVRRSSDAGAIFDLELEADEIGNLLAQPGRVVLAPAGCSCGSSSTPP
jgi:hypothetical protein